MKLESDKAPGMEGDWAPSIERDRNQIAAELELVLNAQVFRRGGRYSALLRHVVERTLEGRSADLKERIIGIEVFHRPNDYDTAADPVVRFCAGEVRKRLAQHYQKSLDDPIVIELPLGSYVPTFHYRKPIHSPNELVLQSAQEPSHETFGSTEVPASDTQTSHTPAGRLSRRTKYLIAIAAVCLIAVGFFVFRMNWREDVVSQVWKPFLDRSITANICTGSPPPEAADVADDAPNASIEEHFLRSGHRISFPTAAAITDISGFLQGHKQPYELTEATDQTVDSLRHHPLVLVNANNNQWTLLLLQPLRFHFESEGHTGYIVDSEHPEQRSWHIDFNQPYRQQTEDYAIVARFFDKTIGAPVLVTAGISSNGTRAAGEFSISPDQIGELIKGAPAGWQTMNFETVLKVQIVQGRMGAVQIVAKKFW